jgi:hypothetical protein
MKKTFHVFLMVALVFVLTSTVAAASGKTYETRIGTLDFNNSFEVGYPSKETITKLFDAYDFNNAVTAYIWGLPLVAYWNVNELVHDELGLGATDIAYFKGIESVRFYLTANNNTPYIVSRINLAETGPLTIEVPPGLLLGVVDDAWQRPVVDLGLIGHGKGRGETLLILGPGQELDAVGYHTVRSKTNHIWVMYRILERDPAKAEKLLHSIRHVPYAQRLTPPPQRVVTAENFTSIQSQPRGMAYWESLHRAISGEVVEERDRLILGMLKPLGIEKGKPFNPTERQKKLLEEAAFVGEAMVKAITHQKRFPSSVWREGSQWKHLLNTTPNQRAEHYDMLEARSAFFYEATSMSPTYMIKYVGKGTKYIFTYRDSSDNWLDGGKDYVLRVPADVPAKIFWDVSVYEVGDRLLIDNEQKKVNLGSLTDELVFNDDGSADIYFGPNAPEGNEANWIQTKKDEDWFAVFRFYGPLEPYYDGSFTLPDIERR